MNTRVFRILFAVAAFGCLPSFASADVAFSDLSATSPYFDTTTGYVVGNSDPTMPFATGAQFMPTLSGGITSVVLGLDFISGNGNVNVYLEPVPATPGLVDLNTALLLGTATATNTYPSSQTTNVSLLAPGLISLAANQQYYLIAQPFDTSTFVAWEFNNTGAQGNIFQSSDDGLTFFPANNPQPLPAFEIDVAAVPEPSSLWVGVASVIGALILHLRKKTSRSWC